MRTGNEDPVHLLASASCTASVYRERITKAKYYTLEILATKVNFIC